MKKPLKYAFGIVMLVLLAIVFASESRSQEYHCRYVQRTYPSWDSWTGQVVTRWRYVRKCHRNHAYYLPEDDRRTRVYSYVRRDDDDRRAGREDRGKCARDEESHRPVWIDVLSTEHQSEESAREAARKAWMARSQWEVGGAYMNLDEAEGVRWRCGPSNAHDTASGRISEAVGTVTGKGGQNVRCALSARPCKGPRESDRGRR